MRRREFLGLVGGAAAWPMGAGAQQRERMRRIGIFSAVDQTEPLYQVREGILREGLATLGWIEGHNLRLDLHYPGNNPDRLHGSADDLVRLAPDLIVAFGSAATRALMQRTRTIPIVFANVGDPVAGGLLKNIARPEGNATGATNLLPSLAGKWLELLKEAAPRTSRIALIFSPAVVNETYFATFDAAAEVLGVKAIRMAYLNAAELQHSIDAFAAEANGGLVMVPPPAPANIRSLINQLALKHRLPTISSYKDFGSTEGSLMSYGPTNSEQYRIAASYVDRILRGAKVSELPVQFPTRYELVVNLKTAKAIGLTIPEGFLLRADEIIE